MADQEQISYNGWQIAIKRKAYRRTLAIVLKPFQGPTVHASLKTPVKAITKFLESRKTWIERNLKQFELFTPPPSFQFTEGEIFFLRGQELGLQLKVTLLKKPFFKIEAENRLVLYLPLNILKDKAKHQAQINLALKEFLKKQASTFMSERLQFWSQKMQLFPKQLSFRGQKSRWGSCSSRGHISLNWKLISAPDWVIDSVVIHELAHLRYMNHSVSFWRLVYTFCPNYKETDVWLHKNQYLFWLLE